jgi:hypothetical protein
VTGKSETELEQVEDCATAIISYHNPLYDLLRDHYAAPDGLFDLYSVRFGTCRTDTDGITVDTGLE